jgi:hypothetical protein
MHTVHILGNFKMKPILSKNATWTQQRQVSDAHTKGKHTKKVGCT